MDDKELKYLGVSDAKTNFLDLLCYLLSYSISDVPIVLNNFSEAPEHRRLLGYTYLHF